MDSDQKSTSIDQLQNHVQKTYGNNTNMPQKPPTQSANSQDDLKQSKLTLGDCYAMEKSAIIQEIGDLEQIRLKLGLSQRKICQLLLVDPSAWTRWSKNKGAPPHIYRSLKWYLKLRETNPTATLGTDLDQRLHKVQEATQITHKQQKEHSKRLREMEGYIRYLEKKLYERKDTTTISPNILVENKLNLGLWQKRLLMAASVSVVILLTLQLLR